MKNNKYYTHEEAQKKMFQLFSEGKSLVALKDDPKCPPQIKENLTKMAALHKETIVQLMATKGGDNGLC